MGRKRGRYRDYEDLAQALKRKGKRENLPCWLCKHPIDYDLPRGHPMSYSYDHDHAIAAGGTMRGAGRPSHLSCNARRGAGRNVEVVTVTNRSRRWV